jgi:hypothetical protein
MSSHQAPRDPFPLDVPEGLDSVDHVDRFDRLDGCDRFDGFDGLLHRAGGHDAPPHLSSVRVVALVSAVVILVGICLSFPG